MKKLMNNFNLRWNLFILAMVLVLSFGIFMHFRPIPEAKVVQALNNGDDVRGVYMKFKPNNIVNNTAIGDVIHTEDGKVAIQSSSNKYWTLGDSYVYRIMEVDEMLGIYIITVDTGKGDDK